MLEATESSGEFQEAIFVMEKRAVSTEHLYGRLVRRILARFSTEQRSGREGVETLGTLEELGVWLRSQPWSISTLRLYRMALLWYFADVGKTGSREEIGKILGMEGAVRQKRRGGPGKRRKSEKGWEPVAQWLMQRSAGVDVVIWMEAAMRSGYRPGEWWESRLELECRRLWIPTAKVKRDEAGNRLRGVGIEDGDGRVWRYLEFSSAEDWQAVQDGLSLRDRVLWKGLTAQEVLAGYAQWLRRGWDAVHGSVRPRITLYSARHIFAGRLKKAGVDRRTLAAAMGQISTKSSKVYGRTHHAGAVKPGVVVPALLVDTVRSTGINWGLSFPSQPEQPVR
jgi:integrase